jgi:hypothetical protein
MRRVLAVRNDLELKMLRRIGILTVRVIFCLSFARGVNVDRSQSVNVTLWGGVPCS